MADVLRGNFDAETGFSAQTSADKVIARFYAKSVPDPEKSKAAGHPVNVDVVYFYQVQPGEARLMTIDRPATNEDIRRFPQHWAAYNNDKKESVAGAPLSLLFPANPSIVENMRFVGVQTVEQLAALSDTALQEIGIGGREFQEKAKQYLDKANDGKGFHALNQHNEALARDNKAMAARIAALEASQEKRKPGRPRKDAEAA